MTTTTTERTDTVTLPAGQYFIGDPCLVVNDITGTTGSQPPTQASIPATGGVARRLAAGANWPPWCCRTTAPAS